MRIVFACGTTSPESDAAIRQLLETSAMSRSNRNRETCRVSLPRPAYEHVTNMSGGEFGTYVDAVTGLRRRRFLHCAMLCNSLQQIVYGILYRGTQIAKHNIVAIACGSPTAMNSLPKVPFECEPIIQYQVLLKALMLTVTRHQQAYDHRLRLYVHDSGDVEVASQLGVPRSTAHGWRKRPGKPVVTLAKDDNELQRLANEVTRLRRCNAVLCAWLRIAMVVLKLSKFSFEGQRLPEGKDKSRLLRAIDRAHKVIDLQDILKVIGLSSARFHAWRSATVCELTDCSSCPKTHPTQVTSNEISTIREMVTSDDYRHIPTSTLAKLAQRIGRVYGSASTWYRLMRIHKWRRPRLRVHPPKPKVGIRASMPNEVWHVDMTLIRLLDGTKVYLHAVIDNFSRRILAWKTSAKFDPAITAEILNEAAEGVVVVEFEKPPQVMVDGGVENYNELVDTAIITLKLKRLLAQTEITYSNSMIEAWWRVLKHQWLYLNQLDSCATVTKLVTFYVEQHNKHLPHSAFKGQTPDEMYDSTGAEVPAPLEIARTTARAARRETNLAVSCKTCLAKIDVVQLQSTLADTSWIPNTVIEPKNQTSGKPTVSQSARIAENRTKNGKSSDKF